MRFESSVTSVSWIPSESVSGLYKAGFAIGASHSDEPPPEVLEDLAALRSAERFRFANQLAAWIEVEDGRVTAVGYAGRGYISSTRFGWGPQRAVRFAPAAFPELRTEPEITATGARFSQTAGGRTGAPMPRRVSGKPYLQWRAPTVWTTLALTIGTDGSSHGEMTGASPFPRHWLYDAQGKPVAKSGLADFREWMATAHGQHSPWGERTASRWSPWPNPRSNGSCRPPSCAAARGLAVRMLAKGALLAGQGEVLVDGIDRIGLVRPLIWTYWIAFSYCLGRYLVIASGGSYRWLSASKSGYGSSRDGIVRSSFTLQENHILKS